MPQKRVLITGISGFAGRFLSPHLAEAGYAVFGTSHDHTPADSTGAQAVYAVDLRNAARTAEVVQEVRPSHVVHLAAISFVGHENVGEIYETNIVGTRNLLAALTGLDTRPEAVLLTSSANVYGNSTLGVLSEEDDVNPANDYAVSKIAMEYMARQFGGRLPIVISRPFNYTGPGQSANFLVPKIVNHFRDRAPFIELGNTEISRDFSDVRAVVEYCRRLLEVPAAIGQIYNICTGTPHTLQFIIDTCASLSGHHLEIRVNPAFVRGNEIKALAGNPAKLHRDLGPPPVYAIEDTLKWMLEA